LGGVITGETNGSTRVTGAIHDTTVDHHGDNGTKRFVTFYITNFSERANYWYLRKGFEVCRILDDVYVAPRCNIR